MSTIYLNDENIDNDIINRILFGNYIEIESKRFIEFLYFIDSEKEYTIEIYNGKQILTKMNNCTSIKINSYDIFVYNTNSEKPGIRIDITDKIACIRHQEDFYIKIYLFNEIKGNVPTYPTFTKYEKSNLEKCDIVIDKNKTKNHTFEDVFLHLVNLPPIYLFTSHHGPNDLFGYDEKYTEKVNQFKNNNFNKLKIRASYIKDNHIYTIMHITYLTGEVIVKELGYNTDTTRIVELNTANFIDMPKFMYYNGIIYQNGIPTCYKIDKDIILSLIAFDCTLQNTDDVKLLRDLMYTFGRDKINQIFDLGNFMPLKIINNNEFYDLSNAYNTFTKLI